MRRVALGLWLLVACHVAAAAPVKGGESDWKSLFNGKDLDGWVVKCRPDDRDKTGYWKVVDGTITAETPPGSKHHYIWLLTEKEYRDFVLRLKVQTYSKTTGNSGVQVRSRYDGEAGWLDGPQVDINPPGPWRSGFIYDETRGVQVWLWPDVGQPANAKPEHAPQGSKWFHADDRDVWNEVQITCQGTRITTVVNGVTIADYDGAGRLDEGESILVLVGGLPAVREWPWEYKADFSPCDVIEEYVRPARYVANGVLVTRPALSAVPSMDSSGARGGWG